MPAPGFGSLRILGSGARRRRIGHNACVPHHSEPIDPGDATAGSAGPTQRAREQAEFRALLNPSREVPRFDPLPVTLTDPEPEAEPDERDVFQRVVAGPRDIPRFEPLDGAGEVPGFDPDVVRRRRRKRRRSRHRHRPARPITEGPVEPEPAAEAPVEEAPVEAAPVEAAPVEAAVEAVPEPSAEARPPVTADKRETLIVVGVLAVLLLLAAVYVLAQRSDQPADSSLPQGASLVSSQPPGPRA